MKSLIITLLLVGQSAFAMSKKVSLKSGINLVKVTLKQEMPGCGPGNSTMSVVHFPSKDENRFIIAENRDLTAEQLIGVLAELSNDKTCPSTFKVTRTVQFISFGSGEISVISPFPWDIVGEPEVSIAQ